MGSAGPSSFDIITATTILLLLIICVTLFWSLPSSYELRLNYSACQFLWTSLLVFNISETQSQFDQIILWHGACRWLIATCSSIPSSSLSRSCCNVNGAVFERIASVCGGESICRILAVAWCWLAGNHFQHDEHDSDGQGGTKFSVYRSVFTKLSLFIDASHEKQYESSL